MSDDWPHGWYSDEPDRPGAGGQRPQPSYTPNSPGSRAQRPPDPAGRGWYAPGNAGGGNRGAAGDRGAAGPGPGDRAAWPVITRNGEPVWLPGVCRAHTAIPEPGSSAVRLDVAAR